jgi:hypothetical protein
MGTRSEVEVEEVEVGEVVDEVETVVVVDHTLLPPIPIQNHNNLKLGRQIRARHDIQILELSGMIVLIAAFRLILGMTLKGPELSGMIIQGSSWNMKGYYQRNQELFCFQPSTWLYTITSCFTDSRATL